VQFTAVVAGSSPSSDIVPNGRVQFSDGIVPLGPPVALDADGRATTPPVDDLDAGTHTVRAEYLGDAAHDPSTGSTTQTVGRLPVAVTMSSSANPSADGEAILLQADISGDGPTGTVQFVLDGFPYDAPAPVVAGSAIAPPIDTLSTGTHMISSFYSGDATHAPANGLLTQIVGDDALAVTVSSSANPVVSGTPVVLQASVARSGPGAPPTGQATFRVDGVEICGGVAIDAGIARCAFDAVVAAGAHTVDVQVSGADGDGSGSAVLQVLPIRTTAAISVSPSPAPFGQEATVDAVVAPVDAAAPTPAGSVQFVVDGDPVGSPVALVGGRATGVPLCDPSPPSCVLSPGGHVVEAAYLGDGAAGRFAGSHAATVHHVVNAPTTTSITADGSDPVPYGRPVTVSAQVTAPASAGAARGSVQFLVDGTDWGDPVPLRGGRADALPLASLTPGTHVVIARYDGAPGLAPSEAQLSQRVDAPPHGGGSSAAADADDTPGPAADTTGPSGDTRAARPHATAIGRSARVDRAGSARIALRCSGPVGRTCRGRLELRHAGSSALLAQRRYAIRTGATPRLVVDLGATGERVLSRHARITVRVRLLPDTGSTAQDRDLVLRSTSAPRATIVAAHATASHRVVRVPVRCRAASARYCRTTVSLSRAGHRLGRTDVSLRGARTTMVAVRLTRAARAELADAGRLVVHARVRSTVPVGRARRDGRRLVVRER
jgi:hypothetical protein